MTLTPTLYKIVTETLWQEARQNGVFRGAEIDLKDGFIHFSTASQAIQTAALHFAGRSGLLLVAVDAASLGDKLIFEPSRGGDLFPHLYADLPLSDVFAFFQLPMPEHEGAISLRDWMTDKLARDHAEGDGIDWHGAHFRVLGRRDGRIARVGLALAKRTESVPT